MARKKKIDNSLLKRLKLKENNEKRKFENRIRRERFLIVCEGTKTEPNYFKSLEKNLPKGVVELEILGVGANTISLVNHAIKERDKNQDTINEYDHCWVVFDKDDFPSENFNNAIFSAQSTGINCAYSNEAFELWYILHFQYLNTALKRQQYFKILSKILGFEYAKGMEDIYDVLNKNGSQENAIEWAKELDESYDNTNPAEEKPNTKVYLLVQSLIRFIQKEV